ncbi:type I restriction-modification system DNA methylase subunit [Flavobacterium sp. 28A]|uniref:Eco57I restriction-modification methylase domain-containing protein n=1 Tax=Flavobacterium sp. 28A TaxID=2735895 RepID=UPI00156F2F68|nr:TaqI-like C-terminal specificity domain-containing protein [Flavobacterium sp. 28A]NRT14176.1 type I restriction-modification system DNA methylase subunit [Flavobacterium sp. 28A]
MALYQKSVLNKHLKQLEHSKVSKAYKKYIKYFLNPIIQDNIRNSKEEEYQGIFLTELFVNVLDYTLKPNVNFDLVAEYKNQTNSRKADGAILKNDVAVAVIELKGTKTKDLESIRQQAFDYKANQKECVYVITSNYEKLRFYINDATEFEEFNLFDLSEQRFEVLYLCLQKDNVLNNIPLQVKEASIIVEEQITKQFYKDYSVFKRELFRDLVKRNAKKLKSTLDLSASEMDEEAKAEQLRLDKNLKLTLFKKSQKLIDRFLFIFFAEDRGLLPPNSTIQILNKWKADVDFGDERPLYDMFKQYFKFLDTGRQGTTNRAEIYAYNGGLFKEDTLLDKLEIDNDLLFKHTQTLASYDFESQVDVNILGHIFENSLNEIESVNAEIEGGDFDKQTSKRKKDGVFYTPKYITKYIVENTIGKLCDEKKNELGFKEEEYFKGRKNRQQNTIVKLVETLDVYREWLLQLTICDPACGSGAFLNQALDFLIKEHNYIDELKAKILGGGLVFSDIENTILENNIFGVDLNEESVEIAKLSLWLRTAQPRRKLNNLNSNIKCGNSLIESKAVAGDKAFNWKEQFPNVFEQGGFDVIIGNPPYVPTEYIDEIDKKYLEKKYQSAFGRINLYPIFYEKGISILNKKGLLGFVTPYTILKNKYYKEARKYIIENSKIIELIDFKGVMVFQDAAVDSIILILQNIVEENYIFKQISNIISFESFIYTEDNFSVSNIFKNEDLSMLITVNDKLIKKVSKDTVQLSKIINFNQGIITGGNSKYLTEVPSEVTEKVLTGSDFNRYNLKPTSQLIIYDTKLLHRPRKREIYEVASKILLRQTASFPICMLDNEQYYTLDTVHNGLLLDNNYDLKYVLTLLNSKLLKFLYESSVNEGGKVFAQVKIMYVDPLPIKKVNKNEQISFITKADLILSLNEKLQDKNSKFTKYLESKFAIKKLTRKLENWYGLEFGEFVKEISKAITVINKEAIKSGQPTIKELSKLDEMDWMEVFETKKAEAQTLKKQIDATDREIDAMVYELYGLTAEEIAIVENS